MNRELNSNMNRWDEIANDIFLDAAEISDEQARARFLDEKCGRDESLKRKVESLIGASQGVGDFLNEPIAPFDVDQATALHAHVQLIAGESVGHYKLLQQIGEGGFGVVYMAEQKQPVRRKVALKIIKPGMDTREVIARFEAERQAVAMMDHPNIAKVFDAGTTDTGRPYFVMELVKGVPITQFCDENQLTTHQRLGLFITVCNAVQHAHQKGVIHRDLKPSNIMVTLNDGEPMPKVIDFGVAKAINCDLTDKTLFTLYGQMVGTPQYMSPEQAEISATDLDTRSDIYSLGVLLFELLTGSPPLEEERLRASAFAELQRMIREEEAPKISTRLSTLGNKLSTIAYNRKVDPAKLQRDLSGDLDWIVLKSLEKDRNRRYETANGFATDIQHYLNDEPVVACPPSTAYRLRKFARRNKTILLTAAIVTVALLVGTIVSTSQAIRAIRAADLAKINEQKAKVESDRAQEQKQIANEQTKLAQQQTERAQKSEEELRDELYASNMNLASEAYAQGDIDRMKELIDAHIPVSAETEMDQRGFEWYLWWRAGHLSKGWARNTRRWPFQNLAVSPDSKIVAASDWNAATIHVYDRESMRLLCSPLPAGSNFDRLRFSPDGRFLIAADPVSSPIRMFDTQSWGHVATLHAGPTSAVAFARDQPILASDGWGEITLWNTSSWRAFDSLPAKDHSSHLALNPDGTKLVRSVTTSPAVGSPLDRIELWDVTERRLIRILKTHHTNDDDFEKWPDENDEITFSPDGRRLAIGDRNGTLRIWEVTDLFSEGREPPPRLTLSATNPIESVAFSPDSTRVAVGTSKDNAVLVWEIHSDGSEPMATIRGHATNVSGVAFVGNSNTVCSCSTDGYVKIWDLSACHSYDVIRRVNSKSHAGYCHDGRLIYLDSEGLIQGWDVTARESRKTLGRERKYSHIALSTDGCVLAGISRDERQLRVWNLENESLLYASSLETLRQLTESREDAYGDRSISRLVVSNDGRMIACLIPWRGGSGHVVLVNSEDGEFVGDAHELSQMKAWPAFSPSGGQIVTQGYMDTTSRLSDVTANSVEQRHGVRGTRVALCAAFSPDGATLAVGGMSREIRLCNAASGGLIQALKGHTQPVTSVAFSRDGKRIISGGLDGTVRIWIRGGKEEYRLASTLRSKSQSIELVAVAPSCDSIAAVNSDGSIQVWRSASSQEARQSIDDPLVQADDSLDTDPVLALSQLDNVLTQVPTDLRARTLRGRLHDRNGNWPSAVEDWTTAHASDPDNHYFLQSRARANALGGQWKQALADWNRLVQLTDEANGEYLVGRGECLLHMGRRDDAHGDLMKALTRTTSVETVERIISLLGFAKSVVPTGSQWRYATGSLPPRNWESTDFADSQWQTGWAPLGDGERDLPTRTDWGDQDVWLRHTFELEHGIDSPLALRLRADEDIAVYINGVSAAASRGTSTGGEYKRVYELVECSSQVRLRPGKNVLAVHCQNQRRKWRTYVDVGLYVRAEPADIEAILIAATERAPDSAVLHTAIALRYAEQREWEEAAVHFHRSAGLSPGRDVLWIWAALMCCHSGNPDGYHQLTTEILERFGETNSPHRAARFAIACLLKQAEEPNLAGLLKLVNTALELEPSSGKLRDLQIAKALAEYRNGNDQAGIEWAEKLISPINKVETPTPEQRQGLAVLALAHARSGDVELARKELAELNESVEDKLPFNTEIRHHGLAFQEAICQTLLGEVKQRVTEE